MVVVAVLADPLASPAPVNAERAAAATTSAMVTVSTSMVYRDIAFACTGRLLVTVSVFIQRWHYLVQQPAFQVYRKSNCNQSN